MPIFNFFKGNEEIEKTFKADDRSDKQFKEIDRRINANTDGKIEALIEKLIERNMNKVASPNDNRNIAISEKILDLNESLLADAKEGLETLYSLLEDRRLKPVEERTQKEKADIEKIVEHGKKLKEQVEKLPVLNEELKKQILERNEKVFRLN